MYIYENISLNSSQNKIHVCFRQIGRENQNTHFACSTFFPRKIVLCYNLEEYSSARQATDDSIVQRKRVACWIPKATNKHSEYCMLFAFLRQHSLRERAWMLRYVYIACLVCNGKDVVFRSQVRPSVCYLTCDINAGHVNLKLGMINFP